LLGSERSELVKSFKICRVGWYFLVSIFIILYHWLWTMLYLLNVHQVTIWNPPFTVIMNGIFENYLRTMSWRVFWRSKCGWIFWIMWFFPAKIMVLMNFIYFCHLHRNYRLNVGGIWWWLLLTVDKSCSAHANFDTSFAHAVSR
jgi:hypothetical protein